MKTKYINSILVFVMSILLVSCDLETNPTNAVNEKEVFKTTASTEKVLNGTWANLMETYYSFANPGYGAFLLTNDAMGSDVVVNTRYGFRNQYAFTALYAKEGTNTFSWALTYKTINNANAVIQHIDSAVGSDEDKMRIKGQALALRGFMYLHLASGYAFAVDKDPNALVGPIYLTPTTSETKPRSAASVLEVYKQSIADLEEALSLIPENYKRNRKDKIDVEVTLGLLSRATLYAREWDKSKKYSDQLLAKNNYLMTEKEYKSGFNDVANNEWIWGHAQTAEQSNASYLFHYLDTTSEESYYYSFNVDPYFKDLFEEGDYRKSLIYWAPDPGKNPKTETFAWLRYAKFKFKAGSIADIVLMRTSEIYLINAEAKARLGDGDALNVVNTLLQARGASPVAGVSGTALLDVIWKERRKELFGEGFGLIDIIRNQQSVVRKAYPQDVKVTYRFNNEQGQEQEVQLIPQGHRILNFPDQSPFVANSPYYLYRVPNAEELINDTFK